MSESARVKISDLTPKGLGVARLPDDRKCFVFGVCPGDEVLISYKNDERGFPNVQSFQITARSPDRVDPECPQFDRCPGCPFRAYAPKATGQFLKADHLSLLKKKGIEVSEAIEQASILLPEISRNGYRARLSAEFFRIEVSEGSKLICGMKSRKGAPIDLSECPAQTTTCRLLLKKIAETLDRAGFDAMDPEGDTGLRQAILYGYELNGDRSAEHHNVFENARAVICYSGNIDPEPALQKLGLEFPGLSIYVEKCHPKSFDFLKAPQWIAGPRQVALNPAPGFHRLPLTARLPSWMPQCPQTLPALLSHVISKLQPSTEDRILEIGCGIGTLSLPLAERCKFLTGVDLVREAIEDAKQNAERAGIQNVCFKQADAEHASRKLIRDRFDLALLHAMRLPFGSDVLPRLALMGIKRIVYLAPNVASLAEDLKRSPFVLKAVDFQDQSPGATGLMTIATLWL